MGTPAVREYIKKERVNCKHGGRNTACRELETQTARTCLLRNSLLFLLLGRTAKGSGTPGLLLQVLVVQHALLMELLLQHALLLLLLLLLQREG